ncbi:unnamed protein product, partial [Cylicostephanus goldi]
MLLSRVFGFKHSCIFEAVDKLGTYCKVHLIIYFSTKYFLGYPIPLYHKWVDRYARDRLLGIECDEDPCHTAVLFCTVCESHLCEKCADTSHDTNVLSKHRRIPLSEKPASTANCRIHNSYPIEFVCKESGCSDRNGLMCIFCRDYGLHKVHSHFNRLREALCRDEEAAVSALTTHVTSRVTTLNAYIENLDAVSSK